MAPAHKKEALDEATKQEYAGRNALALNDALQKEQTRNRQLGATFEDQEQAQQSDGSVERTMEFQGFRAKFQGQGRGGGGGGSGGAMTGSYGFTQAGNIADLGVFQAMRVGLMGVDVDLPKVGKVYYFSAPRAGGSIGVDASEEGMSSLARWAIFVLVLGALVLAFQGARRAIAARRA
jgi:hypothetical protein